MRCGFISGGWGRAWVLTRSGPLHIKDAEALVAFRKANGNFADFDAVQKVPDIDVKTLEEHKDAIAF
jgi:DNA uptake protein ComE-like DNA-binding protein